MPTVPVVSYLPPRGARLYRKPQPDNANGHVTAYAFPNDSQEVERLSFQSEVITSLFEGKLFFAPLSKSTPPRTILDIATGTGQWAIDIGDYFPNAEVTATDLSPIQPAEVPPNVNFYVEDS